jgi:hypothetical protein
LRWLIENWQASISAPAAVGRGRVERAPDRQKEDSLEGFSGEMRELFSFIHLFYTTHDTTTKAGCQVFFGTKFLFFARKIQRSAGGAAATAHRRFPQRAKI